MGKQKGNEKDGETEREQNGWETQREWTIWGTAMESNG